MDDANNNRTEFMLAITSAISGVMQPLIDKLDLKIDRLQAEHRVDYERLRAEIATMYYSKAELNPQLEAMRKDTVRAKDDALRELADTRKEVEAIQKARGEDAALKKARGDRNVARVGGYVTIVVGILSGLAIAIAFLAQHWHW